MPSDNRLSQADIDTIAMLSVRVRPELRKRLKRFSVESGNSMAEIVETAITRYLDEELQSETAPAMGHDGRRSAGGRSAPANESLEPPSDGSRG
jgi:predicted transcriptional regulator